MNIGPLVTLHYRTDLFVPSSAPLQIRNLHRPPATRRQRQMSSSSKEVEDEQLLLLWRHLLPNLSLHNDNPPPFSLISNIRRRRAYSSGTKAALPFASIASTSPRAQWPKTRQLPSLSQLAKHPLALLALVPKDLALFTAGAISGAAAKTLTAPLDRIKLLMQTHGLRVAESTGQKAIGFIEYGLICPGSCLFDEDIVKAVTLIRKEEGIKGYWKGNLPQLIRIVPYSAAQLFAYEFYKKLFRNKDGDLSVLGRLVAGACAGMTSTLVTYPLDVLRLRLAVEPGTRNMSQVALCMLRDEGIVSFYSGLGPSLIGIAPYIALNFCVYDLIKKSLPVKYQKRPETSLAAALMSATFATLMCYPLDTVRRQMQMKNSPYRTVLDAIPGILERDGLIGLYRGFVPNALKSLPNSSVKLTVFDAVKGLISSSEKELRMIMEQNCGNSESQNVARR